MCLCATTITQHSTHNTSFRQRAFAYNAAIEINSIFFLPPLIYISFITGEIVQSQLCACASVQLNEWNSKYLMKNFSPEHINVFMANGKARDKRRRSREKKAHINIARVANEC